MKVLRYFIPLVIIAFASNHILLALRLETPNVYNIIRMPLDVLLVAVGISYIVSRFRFEQQPVSEGQDGHVR